MLTAVSGLTGYLTLQKMLYCIRSDQYTNNSWVFFFLRADTDQEETDSSD